jgi:predicted small secreted protein
MFAGSLLTSSGNTVQLAGRPVKVAGSSFGKSGAALEKGDERVVVVVCIRICRMLGFLLSVLACVGWEDG